MRQAIGTQSMPPNQLLIGFALFLSAFVMMPTGKAIYTDSVEPYMNKQITTTQAISGIEGELRNFMSSQVRKADIGLFYEVTGETAPQTIDEVPLHFSGTKIKNNGQT